VSRRLDPKRVSIGERSSLRDVPLSKADQIDSSWPHGEMSDIRAGEIERVAEQAPEPTGLTDDGVDRAPVVPATTL
jgi:hypothetical protein